MNILGDAEIAYEQALKWVTEQRRPVTETCIGLIDLYWVYAPERGVRPEVAYAQACKETEFGKDVEGKNPGWLLLPRSENLFAEKGPAKFPTWAMGVIAHLDHLALLAGAPTYPREITPDPQHFTSLIGKAETVQQLSGVWSPSASYGKAIATYVEQMRAQ